MTSLTAILLAAQKHLNHSNLSIQFTTFKDVDDEGVTTQRWVAGVEATAGNCNVLRGVGDNAEEAAAALAADLCTRVQGDIQRAQSELNAWVAVETALGPAA